MNEITKIRTKGTLEDYAPQGIHANTLYQVEGTDTILYNGKPLTNEDVEEELKKKANIEDLPNIIGEEVIDKDTFPEIKTLTREELKKDLFDDLWLTAVGIWGKIEHGHMEEGVLKEYYLNELYLTYEEAVRIYQLTQVNSNNNFLRLGNVSEDTKDWPRTNLPRAVDSHGTTTSDALQCYKMFCYRLANIEVLNIGCSVYQTTDVSALPLQKTDFPFVYNCAKLRKVVGVLSMYGCNSFTMEYEPFAACPELVSVAIYNIRSGASIKFNSVPKLDADSVRTMIQRMWAGEGFSKVTTLTFHVDVYNKIVEGSGEWNGILELAESKNITIASA